MKFHENILNGFHVIERTRLGDGQTDRRTDNQGKNNMSPSLSGFSSIIYCFLFTSWRANEAYDFCIGHYFTDLINRTIK